MPFTPSHAVVALPFVRTPLVPSAIAVGAMAPDLPLFVSGFPLHYGRTHDLLWIPATVLVALALLLVWRFVLRPATRELAPTWLARRLPREWDEGATASLRDTLAIRPARESGRARRGSVSAAGLLLLLVSLVVGILTHIVWDLFTHEDRWGVEAFPVLDEGWGPMTGYKWLQHGSSIVGLVTIGIWMLVWLSRQDASAAVARMTHPWVRWAWWASLPIVLAAAWVWGLGVFGPLGDDWTATHLAYRILPPACAVWGVLTVVLCVVVQALRRPAGREAPPLAAREG